MKNVTLKMAFACLSVTFMGIYATFADVPANVSHTVISFEPGSAVLSQDSKDKLKNAIRDARASGKIKKIETAVWSDNEVPIAGENLSKADRELASRREKVVKSYLKDNLNISSIVQTHNMAERPSWFAKAFNTTDAELKEATNRQKPVVKEEEYRVFKENGRPSVAVVVIKRKEY